MLPSFRKALPLPLIVLLIVTTLTLIRFDRPLIRGDGVAYLVWTDTLVRDLDINLNNQHDRFMPVNTYHIQWNNNNHKWVNIFPFGVAFLQAPFYLIGHLFATNDWLMVNNDYFYQMQGVELPYSLWLMIGANVMALVAVGLSWDIARRYCDRWLAVLLVYLTLIGTPMLFYSTVEPLNSHSPAAFTLSVVMWVMLTRDKSNWRWAVLLGIMAGLTILVRWQLILAILPIYLYLMLHREWRMFWIGGLTTAIALLPLPLIWQEMFGAPFVLPYNEVNETGFLKTDNAWLAVLRYTVLTSPVVVFSFPALYGLFKRDKPLAVSMALMVVGQLLINGAAADWNASHSYGLRRMTELFPVYVIGVAVTFNALHEVLLRREKPIMRWIPHAVAGMMIGYTILYTLSVLSYVWTSEAGWTGKLTPQVVLPYFAKQPNNMEVVEAIFTTHLGPPAWNSPAP